MDALAAAVAQGAQPGEGGVPKALRTAAWFGCTESLFTLIGYALGSLLGPFITRIDHWVAFFLLLALGAKMIRDAYYAKPSQQARSASSKAHLTLLAASTSVDAAAVGVTLVVLKIPIIQAALVIGLVTFTLTAIGYLAGNLAGRALPRHAQALGGLVLITIGTNILLSHTLLAAGS